jgi:hypothetical protein
MPLLDVLPDIANCGPQKVEVVRVERDRGRKVQGPDLDNGFGVSEESVRASVLANCIGEVIGISSARSSIGFGRQASGRWQEKKSQKTGDPNAHS